MFEIFKKKKKKTEAYLIFEPLGTDMHCHLLPCVDDGSNSIEESMACLRVLESVGFNKEICTPHFQYPRFPNDEDDIKNMFSTMKTKITSMGALENLELAGIGGEYRIDSGFPDRMAANRFLLVGGKFLLVELSLHQQVVGIEDTLFNLQMKNYEIILAHPERYPYFSAQSPSYERFKDMGINFQVNVLSLSGFYGDMARRKGFELIERGWVEYLGTDTHNMVYGQALIDASRDHKIEKIVSTGKFLNNEITLPTTAKKKRL